RDRTGKPISTMTFKITLLLAASVLFACASPSRAEDFTPEAGFELLFNGKDLSGWRYHASEPFDGKTASSDERYTTRDGIIVVNPPKDAPRKVQQMWTVREFPKDFTLKLEFRAGVNADSGIFVRKPQLQCRDYLVAGPYKELKKYKPQDWNEIEVVVKDGVARCTCNGEVLEAALQLRRPDRSGSKLIVGRWNIAASG
ncbi:MAG: DUF1080 domain-containing protein, partial [Verrucomicrobiota bacterium]|nr:DUF1080 domain-containing protein [Verrucomicrobiota bacterium]